jgi:hypothetical protein
LAQILHHLHHLHHQVILMMIHLHHLMMEDSLVELQGV